MTDYYEIVTRVGEDAFVDALHEKVDKGFKVVKFDSHIDEDGDIVYVAFLYKELSE